MSTTNRPAEDSNPPKANEPQPYYQTAAWKIEIRRSSAHSFLNRSLLAVSLGRLDCAWDMDQLKNSSESLPHSAGEIGGGLEARPRQSRIFGIASGGFIAHRILIRPPQRSHLSTSTEKTLFKSSAQAYLRGRHPTFLCDFSGSELWSFLAVQPA